MRKYLAMLVAAMLCACCLGLAACGGSSSSSSASASSASASASAASASAPASSAAASSAAASSAAASSAAASASSAAASADVSADLKALGDKYTAVCDEVVALAEKGKQASDFKAIEGEWETLQAQLNELTDSLKPWAEKYGKGELSAADKSYYDDVIVPVSLKAVSAASDILDLALK